MMSITWPAAQSILSHKASPSEQGQLQGAINGLRGISGLIGPGLFTYVFSMSIGANASIHVPGAPFFLAASMLLLSLAIVLIAIDKPAPQHQA